MDLTKQAHSLIELTQQVHRTNIIAAIFLLAVLLLVFTNVALIPDDDTLDTDNFFEIVSSEIIWIGMSIYLTLWAFLKNGVSIFSLFVTYKGGRSGRKYFNDRTIANSRLTLESLHSK